MVRRKKRLLAKYQEESGRIISQTIGREASSGDTLRELISGLIDCADSEINGVVRRDAFVWRAAPRIADIESCAVLHVGLEKFIVKNLLSDERPNLFLY